ncbi:MAG: phosphotransferase, partial [Planctomycetota bacterium]
MAASASTSKPTQTAAPEAAAGDAATTNDAGSPETHEVFGRDELAKVLTRYDIGAVEKLEDYPRGSRKAPKLVIKTDRGRFLLKRRAKGREDVNKVAFCHAIQAALAAKQFPLPHLIPTKQAGATMLVLDHGVYELFEFIPGQGYNQSLEATYDSGRILATYHKLLEDFSTSYDPPTGSFHAAEAVEKGFDRILKHFAGRQEIAPTCRFLLDSYRHARDSADDKGLRNWPDQVVHGDWHPGNMLFREKRVVAVIDYDSARALPRVIDTANGALQFSILGGGDDVDTWPDHLDQTRFKRFLRGYDQVNLLSEAELRATPWLMVEALIAEAVFP